MRDVAIKPGVTGPVDLAHAARANRGLRLRRRRGQVPGSSPLFSMELANLMLLRRSRANNLGA